jgi:glycosyltransferase 2 family protein
MQHSKILSLFGFKRIIIPIIIGLGVAIYLFIRSFDIEAFRNVNWLWQSYFYIFLALCLMVVRDVAYMYRIRILTDGQLSWRKSFDVIMMWEFGSAVTPTIIGGSAIALFILRKEGINMGRTTSIVFITALLDELFYIIMVPIIILIVGTNRLFVSYGGEYVLFNTKFGTQGVFIIGYFIIVLLTSTILYGIFIKPKGLKRFLVGVCSIPYLKKYRRKAIETGNEIIITSKEMKGKPVSFWLKAFGGTFVSWTARFWVVNCLILAFVTGGDQFLIYARQLIMWVILLISPTPGGTGLAEVVFSGFLGDFIPQGLTPAISLMWRIISYYPYLFIGVIILPNWLNRVRKQKEAAEKHKYDMIKPI